MPTDLGRRLASASENLRAAKRDGCEADLAMWLEELDALLDEWLLQQSDEVWSDA
jgi:gamma-glutamyl:cysteine ligase YbdK (ATP-grasp superfamily)